MSSVVSKKAQRKERRLQKQKEKKEKQKHQEQKSVINAYNNNNGLIIDDHASAWEDCQRTGRLWGGRGKGGRGLRYAGENLQSIHLPSVSLTFQGNELLSDSPMDIVQGHRYGLLGRNGVGKSTLLKQLYLGAIPGMPR